MKSLARLHQEIVSKVRIAEDPNRAAAMSLIETPIEMIKAIMPKHELAIIKVIREMHESREAAVRAEREECAKVFDEMARQMVEDMEPSTAVAWVRSKAAEIRARGNT